MLSSKVWLFATEFLLLLQLKPIQITCWRQSGIKTPFAWEVSLMVDHLPIKLPPFPLIGMTSFLLVFILNEEVVSILVRGTMRTFSHFTVKISDTPKWSEVTNKPGDSSPAPTLTPSLPFCFYLDRHLPSTPTATQLIYIHFFLVLR